MNPLVLRRLTPADEDQARAGHRELAADGFEFILGLDDAPFSQCLEAFAREEAGVDLPRGRVPATFLGAFVGGDLVGRTSIRHELNGYLRAYGGHVGYGVRPGFRRRGYATAMLRQALGMLHDLGVDQALVTCDDANEASIGVIAACGGALEDVVVDEGGRLTRRYWLATAPTTR